MTGQEHSSTCVQQDAPAQNGVCSQQDAPAQSGACPRQDRRTRRTQRALRNALAQEILATGEFSAVTATGIANRAGITRRSFYTHFRDVGALLAQVEQEALEEFAVYIHRIAEARIAQFAGVLASYKPMPHAVELLDYVRANGALYQALLGEGGDARFVENIKKLIHDIVAPRALTGLDERAQSFFDYYLTYAISAEVGVLIRWLSGGMVESTEVIARIMTVLAFVRPGDLYGIPINLNITAYSEALLRLEDATQ